VQYKYLLVVRFALINLVAFSFLAATYLQGWLKPLTNSHLWELLALIAAVFLYGLAICAWRIWQTNSELDALDAPGDATVPGEAGRFLAMTRGKSSDFIAAQSGILRLRLTNRIAIVGQTANALVFLGLIGTVVGFIIALSGVDPEAATDASRIAPMISKLINGMAVALNTTLEGAVLYIWLLIDYRILASGTVKLLTATIERANGRA
jgi:hypothetical protein